MAKRIKIKGKTPRGLSKAQRIKIAPLQRKRNKIVSSERKRADPGDVSESTLDAIDRYDYMIDEIAERPDIAARPSSTRKKLVKEGNRKFIGPRQLKNEAREDAITRSREDAGPDDYGTTQDMYRRVRKGDRRLFHNSDPSYGRGGISKSAKLKKLLALLMDRNLGGGQEFDAEY